MRERFAKSGKAVKIKSGVGAGFQPGDMSGMDFIIEDWGENVLGCSWMYANENPAALEYAAGTGVNGKKQ